MTSDSTSIETMAVSHTVSEIHRLIGQKSPNSLMEIGERKHETSTQAWEEYKKSKQNTKKGYFVRECARDQPTK